MLGRASLLGCNYIYAALDRNTKQNDEFHLHKHEELGDYLDRDHETVKINQVRLLRCYMLIVTPIEGNGNFVSGHARLLILISDTMKPKTYQKLSLMTLTLTILPK